MKLERVRNPYGAPVYYSPTVASTMHEAKELVNRGAVHGTVIRAGYQTKGRGRLGERVWNAQRRKNLLFTIIFIKGQALGELLSLPVRLGLAVCVAVERFAGIRCTVKWPNDVLLGGRKLCGILCESDESAVLAGIGINVNQRSFEPGYRRLATSLVLETGREYDCASLLEAVLAEIRRVMTCDGWQAEVDGRLHGKGVPVHTSQGVCGTVFGIDGDGALLVDDPEGARHRVLSGEVILGANP